MKGRRRISPVSNSVLQRRVEMDGFGIPASSLTQKVSRSRMLPGTCWLCRGPYFGWDLGCEHVVCLILENQFLPFPHPSP